MKKAYADRIKGDMGIRQGDISSDMGIKAHHIFLNKESVPRQ